MTDIFTASNGIEIEISQDRYLLGNGDYGSGPTYATAGPEGIDALREYFQNERDAELGRWRDEESPDYVVYPSRAGSITILHEPTGKHRHLTGRGEAGIATGEFAHTARRYFATNPEPKPWHSAEAGTFWRIHLDADDGLGRLTIAHGDNTFTDQYGIGWKAHDIHRADRLYPEESRDE